MTLNTLPRSELRLTQRGEPLVHYSKYGDLLARCNANLFRGQVRTAELVVTCLRCLGGGDSR